jgi:hypothetical protein
MEVKTLPMAYKEEVSKNGYLLPKEVLRTAIENERLKIENKSLCVATKFQNDYFRVEMQDVAGYVQSIDIDKCEATVMIEPEFNLDNIELALSLIITGFEEENDKEYKTVKQASILYTVLLPKQFSAYSKAE